MEAWFYQEDELHSLVNFNYEHNEKVGPLNIQNQTVRKILLALLALPYTTAVFFSDLDKFFRPFTNWTLMISTATLLFSIWAGEPGHLTGFCPNCLSCKKAACLKIIFHILYMLSIMMNIVVMSVYWTILHSDLMKDEGKELGRAVHLVLVHSLPGTISFINAYITNARLKMSFWKIIPLMGLLYGVTSYNNQMKYGDV